MILAMYGAEQRAIGKYIQKVESIRDWYEDNDDLLKGWLKVFVSHYLYLKE